MKDYYLKKAEENLPILNKTKIKPAVPPCVLSEGESVTVDLGNHYVGYLSFKMWFADAYIDAPVRMEVRFLECERELTDDYTEFNSGLCRSWLQDEIINVDFPGIYSMPRRYAARFVQIKIIATPRELVLSDFTFEAETSVDTDALMPYSTADKELALIDKIAVNTLKNCMQRVFEDGPKRDRRLWIGDLRLEALTNYYTFDSQELVKRCLYLFAAAEPNEYGIIPGFVYENPIFVSGSWYLIDYALMFVNTLCDFYIHTGDADTFLDIYPVAKRIMDSLECAKDERGLVTPSVGDVFIDWCRGLEKNSSLVGVYLYTLASLSSALEEMGHADAKAYRERLDGGRLAARAELFDKEKGAFINGRDGYQYSVHTASWMVLGGVVSGDEAKRILLDAISSTDSVKPFTPYMHHYTAEALFKAGAIDEGEKYVRRIWGGMAKMGTDTFPEVYSEGDADFSPYRDRKINSMCHAWSCTASYFIRKYALGKDYKTI